MEFINQEIKFLTEILLWRLSCHLLEVAQSICTSFLRTNEPESSFNLKYSRCIFAVNCESNRSLIRCRHYKLPGCYPSEAAAMEQKWKWQPISQHTSCFISGLVFLPTCIYFCASSVKHGTGLRGEWVRGLIVLRKKKEQAMAADTMDQMVLLLKGHQ